MLDLVQLLLGPGSFPDAQGITVLPAPVRSQIAFPRRKAVRPPLFRRCPRIRIRTAEEESIRAASYNAELMQYHSYGSSRPLNPQPYTPNP